MAGISQKVSPDEVLPLLSREVAVKGYQTVTEKSGKAARRRKIHRVLDALAELFKASARNSRRWPAPKKSFAFPVAATRSHY